VLEILRVMEQKGAPVAETRPSALVALQALARGGPEPEEGP
jgi:hypothetical protein